MPLLEGLDGVNKMSKSLGNYVGISEPAGEIFGKLMSISDELMWRYFELLSFRSVEDIADLKHRADEGENPRDIKYLLAAEIVTRFHDAAAARKAQADFIARHRHGEVPDELEERVVTCPERTLGIAHLLRDAALVASTSEAIRLINQGAVRVDEKRVDDPKTAIEADDTVRVYRVGKRKYARIRLRPGKGPP